MGKTYKLDPYRTSDSGLILPKEYLDKKHDEQFFLCWCGGKHWTEDNMLRCDHKGGKVRGRVEL